LCCPDNAAIPNGERGASRAAKKRRDSESESQFQDEISYQSGDFRWRMLVSTSNPAASALESPFEEQGNHRCSTQLFLRGETTMKGDQKVIDTLNAGLTIELTAINQYFCQAKMCKNWGYLKLGAKHYAESLGEMKHAEMLIDRILFLDGVPEIARYDVIRVGSDVKEQFENDLKLEMSGVEHYRNVIDLCTQLKDHGSREMVEPILVESEEHVDWLETQLGLVQALGLQLYLQSQLGDEPAGH
jgi:bacterioferritin